MGHYDLADCRLLTLHQVFWTAATMPPLTPQAALQIAVSALEQRARCGELAPASVQKWATGSATFVRYLVHGPGVTDICDVTSAHVEAFVRAPRTLLKKPACGARDFGGDRKEWRDAGTQRS